MYECMIMMIHDYWICIRHVFLFFLFLSKVGVVEGKK